MKYLFLFIVLVCIVHGLTVHASPLAESNRLMKRCKTNDDCHGDECTPEGTCATAHIDCCWMPPIYCCGG
ncbi:11386_t:CDS:2 [Funneliformis mosseae]|uniref:11386_t:CDS:1 n=1 Tax=Funneliformis mosseae TaxID=27381 RepID=A0A9N9BM18_FUNMO|nr:11386_t:CDS:2 [Funneliformis mosseae]